MFGFIAMVALVVALLVAIVLQAFFVRRTVALRDHATVVRIEYDKLQLQVQALAEEVGALQRGMESNTVAVRTLEAEIEELHHQIENYVPEDEAVF